jgi:hypothetical protein
VEVAVESVEVAFETVEDAVFDTGEVTFETVEDAPLVSVEVVFDSVDVAFETVEVAVDTTPDTGDVDPPPFDPDPPPSEVDPPPVDPDPTPAFDDPHDVGGGELDEDAGRPAAGRAPPPLADPLLTEVWPAPFDPPKPVTGLPGPAAAIGVALRCGVRCPPVPARGRLTTAVWRWFALAAEASAGAATRG